MKCAYYYGGTTENAAGGRDNEYIVVFRNHGPLTGKANRTGGGVESRQSGDILVAASSRNGAIRAALKQFSPRSPYHATVRKVASGRGGVRAGAGRKPLSGDPGNLIVNKVARLRTDQVVAVDALPDEPGVPGFSGKLRRIVDAGLRNEY